MAGVLSLPVGRQACRSIFSPLLVFPKKVSRRCCVLCVGIAAEQRHQQPNYRKPFNRGRSAPNTYHRSEVCNEQILIIFTINKKQ